MVNPDEICRKAIGKVGDRKEAARLLGTVFSELPDKYRAWQDLRLLMLDYDDNVRHKALEALGLAFPYIPDKDQAQRYLHRFTKDRDRNIRMRTLETLRLAYPYILDRAEAWRDLHKFTLDQDRSMRWKATEALGYAYPHIPCKDRAWEDLCRLIQDQDKSVRMKAAEALGSAYPHILDKAQAWRYLHRLTLDPDSNVRTYAYHSLGRVSVFKATEAENREVLLSEIEISISYFENASREGILYNPAEFCLPFYRSYFTITFQSAKEDQVKRYVDEAKKAVGKSECRVELIDAVENLGNALLESQKLKNRSIEEIVNELNAYRWYCEKAAEHMAAVEDRAPGAVKLLRKCNPFLEKRIQTTIIEIQRKSKLICQATSGSGDEYEAIGAEIHRAAKVLSDMDLASLQNCSSRIILQIKKFCKLIQANENNSVCDVLAEMEHVAEYPEKLQKMELALLYLYSYFQEHRSNIMEFNQSSSWKKWQIMAECNDDHIQDSIIGRLRDLKDNVHKDLELLKAYEEEERLTRDPRDLARIQKEIERQRASAKHYLLEYKDLEVQVKNAHFDIGKEVSCDLKQIRDMLVKIQSGQDIIKDDVSNMHKATLEHLDSSEQRVVASVIGKLDKNQLKTVKEIWNAIESNFIPDKEMSRTLGALQTVLQEMKLIQSADRQLLQEIQEGLKILNDPTLTASNRLKLTIPLIPLILTYESEAELRGSMYDLMSAMKGLKAKLKGGP